MIALPPGDGGRALAPALLSFDVRDASRAADADPAAATELSTQQWAAAVTTQPANETALESEDWNVTTTHAMVGGICLVAMVICAVGCCWAVREYRRYDQRGGRAPVKRPPGNEADQAAQQQQARAAAAPESAWWPSLVAAVESHAGATPDARALTWLRTDCAEEAALSFGQLQQQARAVCVALRRRWGVVQGERVLLLFPPGLDFLVAFVGCQYAATPAVPYYPPVPTDKTLLADGLAKVARVIAMCQPKVALSTRSYLRAKALAGIMLPGCAWPELPFHATDELRAPPTAADAVWLDGWVARRCGPADAAEVAFVQFTSGSTGSPKGVTVRSANLLANTLEMAWRTLLWGSRPQLRGTPPPPLRELLAEAARTLVVSWLPLYHDMGLVSSCTPLMLGGRADLLSPMSFLQRPLCWLQAVSQRCGYHVFTNAPNFAYDLCVRKTSAAERRALQLGHCVFGNGAEPVRPRTLRAFAETFGACGFSSEAWMMMFGLAESVCYVAGCAGAPTTIAADRHALDVGTACRRCGRETRTVHQALESVSDASV